MSEIGDKIYKILNLPSTLSMGWWGVRVLHEDEYQIDELESLILAETKELREALKSAVSGWDACYRETVRTLGKLESMEIDIANAKRVLEKYSDTKLPD